MATHHWLLVVAIAVVAGPVGTWAYVRLERRFAFEHRIARLHEALDDLEEHPPLAGWQWVRSWCSNAPAREREARCKRLDDERLARWAEHAEEVTRPPAPPAEASPESDRRDRPDALRDGPACQPSEHSRTGGSP